MKSLLLMGLALAAAMTPSPTLVLSFAQITPGTALPDGWRTYRMSRHTPAATISVQAMDGRQVLHIDADHAAGAVAHRLDLPAATTLTWRWKVDHAVARADTGRKSGDDAAARVYVFFDLPRRKLSWYQRMKLDLARHVLGHPMPTAALCYVWDNTHAPGRIAKSPFFSGMRTIVVESGNGKAGTWQVETRDVGKDYRAAFGTTPPRISGIALAADTDNTHGQAQAWFGQLSLTPDPASATRKSASP